MIKGDVTVCGTINQSAQVKQSKDGSNFISFTVSVPLQGKDSSVCELYVKIAAPGDRKSANRYCVGKHVICNGTLNVRKLNDRVYYNVRCDEDPEIVKPDEPDRIEGTLDFSGAINKKKGVLVKKDKNGKDYHVFSAWSSDKHTDSSTGEEKREFIYVNFVRFDPKPDDPMSPGQYIDCYGDLDINIHGGQAHLECVIKTIKEHHFDDANGSAKQDNDKEQPAGTASDK